MIKRIKLQHLSIKVLILLNEKLNIRQIKRNKRKIVLQIKKKKKKKYKNFKNVDLEIQKLITNLNRQFLHAKTLGFVHPKSNEELIFSSILPQELNDLLKMLRNTSE